MHSMASSNIGADASELVHDMRHCETTGHSGDNMRVAPGDLNARHQALSIGGY